MKCGGCGIFEIEEGTFCDSCKKRNLDMEKMIRYWDKQDKEEKKISLYLAHPFDSRKRMREWEISIEKQSGINIINPFYDVERLDVSLIDSGKREKYEKLDHVDIVERDLKAISRSDGTIAMITGDVSYGTIQEMVYSHLLSKPVYSLITNGQENHPWLRYHSSQIFTELDNLEKFLVGLDDLEEHLCSIRD